MSHNEAIELEAYAEIDTCKLCNHEHEPSCNRKLPVVTLNLGFASFFRKPNRRSSWWVAGTVDHDGCGVQTRMQFETARRLCCEATNRPSH